MAFWYDLRRRLFQDPDRGTHPRQPYALGDRQMYSVASSDNMRPRIVICAPDRLEQTEDIVDQLQSGSSVLLNLETSRRDIARRLLDFIAGVAYHNDNQVRRVARSAYLILPYNAEVEADGYDDQHCG